MDLSVLRIRGAGAFGALLALTIVGAGTMRANTLTITGGPATVTCNTVTGTGTAATLTVKPGTALTSGQTLVVTLTSPGGGLVVSPSAPQTFTFASQTLTYTVNTAPGCVGNSTGATTLTFTPAGGTAANVTVNDTVTATTSGLAVSPVTIECTTGGTPGPAQTLSVTSAAVGGTPFTADPSGATSPDVATAAWLTLSPTTPAGTASSLPVTFTAQAASGCGGHSTVNTSFTTTLYLDDAPAPPKQVVITMVIVAASPLTVNPSSPALTYVKGSGTPGYQDVAVTSSPSGLYVAVNTANLPIWLTATPTSGSAPTNIRFSSTTACDSLAPGTYTTTVYLKVSGYLDTPVNISLLLTNKAPKLSTTLSPGLGANSTPTTQNISWTQGTATPTAMINVVSSDAPIAYTATSGGTLAPIIASSQQSGLAYSFGTQIGVTFNPLIFAAATPGTVLTGTVTLTWGSPASTIVVTFNVTVMSPGSTLSSLSPASIPTAAAGQTFTVVLNGTGFVTSTDPTQKTKVGIVVGGTIVTDTNFAINVVNPSNINLTITVPAVADSNLPFSVSGTGGNVVIGVCNPGGGTCTIPTGQATLTIGAGPIIQAVTSASAFTEVAPGTLPTTSAYDMLSIFGANFCSAGGTGCTSTQILYGTPDALTQRYPTSVTPDTGASPRNLSVAFYVHGAGGAWIGNAPLLFATNSQINLLVPAAVSTYVGAGAVDLVVNFGTGALPTTGAVEAASATSAIYNVNVALTDPGIFTVGADGQGNAAVLNSITYAPITQANPAGMRATGADSDVVSLYVTGLGAPDSAATDGTGGSNTNITDCVSVANYQSALQTASGVTLSNIDGAIIQSSLIDSSRLPPCMAINTGGNGSTTATIPAVTIGGVAVTAISTSVGYAGFVDGAVAGLYQINVVLPSAVAGGTNFTDVAGNTLTRIVKPVQLPVVVTSNNVASQTGVNIWVAPRLKVSAPVTLTGTVGVLWSTTSPANTVGGDQSGLEGTAPYTYALTSGLLPAGLTMSTAGVISGTPAANTGGSYIVTVTATDSSAIPVTGTVTFTVSITADLFMTSTGTAPYTPGAHGSAHAGVTTVKATGGVAAYTYAIGSVTPASGGSASDITLNTSTGVVGVASSAVAGSYVVTITATDSTTGTPLTGSITFTITLS